MSDALERTRPHHAGRHLVIDLANLLLLIVAVVVAVVGLCLSVWARASLDGLAVSGGFNDYGVPIMMFTLLAAGLIFMARHPRR